MTTVLITGASSGIGLALARAYARDGAKLVLNARDEQKLAAAARQLGEPALVPGDIAQPSTAERMLQAAVQRFGRADVLINNAGVIDRYSSISARPYCSIGLTRNASRRTPSIRSSPAMRLLTAEVVVPMRRAAAVNEPLSTTWANSCSAARSSSDLSMPRRLYIFTAEVDSRGWGELAHTA
ncbi:MAG TPA: SDR family NAD(P)-dependent oxidoreductase [Polyangiales bacterium]|nr:SDR family NAD(P)-dependent oxidoreductase [Polyangiales bacterium]